MRRILIPALMITLLLSGCGGAAPERRLEEARAALREAGEIRVTADVTANLENDEVFACTLECMATPEQMRVTITAPESVAGVSAVTDAQGTRLEYGDMSLGIGRSEDAPAPVTALPMLLRALQSGSTLRSWTEWEGERTLFVREYYVTDECSLSVWLDGTTLSPSHAEFVQDGRVAVRCEIRDFSYE